MTEAEALRIIIDEQRKIIEALLKELSERSYGMVLQPETWRHDEPNRYPLGAPIGWVSHPVPYGPLTQSVTTVGSTFDSGNVWWDANGIKFDQNGERIVEATA